LLLAHVGIGLPGYGMLSRMGKVQGAVIMYVHTFEDRYVQMDVGAQ